MKNYLTKYIGVLGERYKKIPVMIFLFISNALIEVVGLSLIAPLMYILIVPDNFNEKFYFLNNISFFKDLDFIYKVSLICFPLIFIYYIKSFFSYFINSKIVNFSYQTQAALTREIVHSYQKFSYKQIIDIKSSKIFNILSVNIRFYTELTLISSLRLVSDSLLLLIIIFFLAYYDPYAVIFLFIFFLTIALIYFKFIKNLFVVYGKKFSDSTENILSAIKEIIGSFKEIRILGKEDFFDRRIYDSSEKMAYYGGKAVAMTQMPKYILESAIITFVVLLALFEVATKTNTSDAIILIGIFAVASARMLPPTFQVITALSSMRLSMPHLNIIYDHLYLNKPKDKEQIKFSNGDFQNNEPFDKLEIKNIDFTYNESKKVFKDFSLTINKGDFVGIYGDSGSGKTTLIDLILGLLKHDDKNDPSNGIFINNKVLSNNLTYWYKKIAYIPQKIFLINDSIEKNISFSDDESEIDQHLLNETIQLSQLNDIIKELPLGLKTNTGDDGMKLSGGQRQRLVLARALYHKRELIIFDEATSALDDTTAKLIMEEIKLLKGSKTVIMISHNLELLKDTDYSINIKKI